MSDEHAQMRNDIADLRGDFREAIATIRGAIEALAATKSGEVAVLNREVAEVRHHAKSTEKVALRLHERLDEYPKPETIEATFSAHSERIEKNEELAQSNRLSIAKLVGPGAVGGVIAAGLIELVARVT